MTAASLIIPGKEYTDEVREDITAGKVAPAIGTILIFLDDTNPNILFPGTSWVNTKNYQITVSSVVYDCQDWLRKEPAPQA
jgi:hypothetical protein